MGPLHPYAAPPGPRPAHTEGKAVVSLVLGLVSLACVGPVAGVPAIIFGSLARRDIDRAGGALTGRALAAGGIVCGLFGTGIGFVLMLSVLGFAFTPSSEPVAETAPASPAPTSVPAPVSSEPPPVVAGVRSFGSLEVVDLDSSRPLRIQLGEIVHRAAGAPHRTVVLQTYDPSNAACAAVDAALPDTRMQGALANVTLVRVDIEEYRGELRSMHVETRSAPWFYKLDAKGETTDALSADAWEANLPEKMAPVLGRFVHRTSPRRHTKR